MSNSEANPNKGTQALVRWAAIIIIIAGMKMTSEILTQFFLALFISIVASQPVLWLTKKGVPKGIGITLVMILIISFGALMGGLIGGSIAQFTQNLPTIDQNFQKGIVSIIDKLRDMGINLSSDRLIKTLDPSKIMGFTASTINGMGSMLGQTLLILLITLFMMFELDTFPMKYQLISRDRNTKRRYNFSAIIHNVRHYLGIKTLTSLSTGLVVAFALKIIGVQFAFLWGLIAFMMNYIPNIGSLLAAIPAVVFALIEHGFPGMLWTGLVYVLVNLVIGSIIEPRIMGEGMGLSTLVVLLSLIFWGFIFGPIGMFLSVPFTMAVKIILETSESSKWLSTLLDSESNTKNLWEELKRKKETTE